MGFNNDQEIEEERKKWELSDEEYEANLNAIFNELVLIGDAEPSEVPSFIMVGGQAGCGKSFLVSKEQQSLETGAIAIDQDVLRTKHPHYSEIHDNYNEREEFLLLKTYVGKLNSDIIKKASEQNYNIILESALRSVSKFIQDTKTMKDLGYNTKLSVLAVSPDEANLSMFTRYCTFLKKYNDCRRNTRVDNDSVKKIPENISKMEEEGIFDEIAMSVRGDEETDFLPKQIYSKQETPDVSASKYYKDTVHELKVDIEEFKQRYKELREILVEYKQDVQIKRLDDFYNSFLEREGGKDVK